MFFLHYALPMLRIPLKYEPMITTGGSSLYASVCLVFFHDALIMLKDTDIYIYLMEFYGILVHIWNQTVLSFLFAIVVLTIRGDWPMIFLSAQFIFLTI